jgi:hypothetical protein
MAEVRPRLEFDPGPVAVRIAMDVIKDLPNVKELTFLTNGAVACMDGRESRGRWDIPTGTITIDVAECVRQIKWVHELGMFITHNIWYNILYAIYHETTHAWQCNQEGWTDKLPDDVNIDLMEREAHDKATDRVLEWFEHNNLPTLNDMGDLGVEIRKLRNSMYASHPHIEEEQRVWGTEAAGRADIFTMVCKDFTGEDAQCLFDRIDEGEFGCVIGGVRYLKAQDLIGSTIHYQAGGAQ